MNTKKILALSAVVTGLLISTQSFAGTIVIDNFSVAQGPISDLTVGDGPVSNTLAGVRVLSSDLLSSSPPVGNTVEVVANVLDITNGSGEDSEATVSWAFAGGQLAGATDGAFHLSVVQSDANATNLQFLLDGAALASFDIAGNTANQDVPLALNAAQLGALNNGGNLTLKINGQPGWDLTLEQFGLSFNATAPVPNVPEPTTMGLIGLSLAGLGFLRRRNAIK